MRGTRRPGARQRTFRGVRGLPSLLIVVACMPLRDLDEAASGDPSAAGRHGDDAAVPAEVAGATNVAGTAAGAASGAAGSVVTDSVTTGPSVSGATSASGGSGAGGTTASSSAGAGALAQGGAACPPSWDGARGGATCGPPRGPSPDGGGREAVLPQGGAVTAAGARGPVGQGGEPSEPGGDGGTSAGEDPTANGAGQGGTQLGVSGAPYGGAPIVAGRGGLAPALDDIPDFPLADPTHRIVLSEEATWIIDGVPMPTHQVETPVGKFMLVKSAAAFVSIEDSSRWQWIAYNAFRPKRGLPALGVCCEAGNPSTLGLPVMTTEVDRESLTRTHVRLVSTSAAGDIHIVWDFYLTHVTITLNALPTPYGFTYRGVPGAQLDPTDELRFSNGVVRSASNAWTGDLPGPREWVYWADVTRAQSLFLIRHSDDDLAESYLVADQDSAKFVFASGQSVELPARFSVGLIDSADHDTVAERVRFVIDATPPPR